MKLLSKLHWKNKRFHLKEHFHFKCGNVMNNATRWCRYIVHKKKKTTSIDLAFQFADLKHIIFVIELLKLHVAYFKRCMFLRENFVDMSINLLLLKQFFHWEVLIKPVNSNFYTGQGLLIFSTLNKRFTLNKCWKIEKQNILFLWVYLYKTNR